MTRQEYRLKYKGKSYQIKRPRVGVCNICRSIKGVDCKQTQWHHIQYDDKNKEKYAIELCAKCHRNETIVQLGAKRVKEIAKIGRAFIPFDAPSKGGKAGIASRYAKHGKDVVLRQMDSNRKMVYNRWTGQLVPRRTFSNV
jgi:hypothetical protein